VLRTLETYLGKDLARATALATAAFTVLMTVFAVLEPMRKYGLSGEQALRLFGYSLPLMFSLTLPIGALFAATIVYGRFSQDNELMACRASGLCTLSLMRPALYLGLFVSAVTLGLGLYVAPKLWTLSERTVKHNLKDITYHRLRTRGHVDIPKGDWIFHADAANPETGWVDGAVVVNTEDPANVVCLVAATAYMEFAERDGRTFVVFHWTNPTVIRQQLGDQFLEREQRFKFIELPGMPDDKPRLYDWNQLWRTWRSPEDSPPVLRELAGIRRELLVGVFYADLLGALEGGGRYAKLAELGAPPPPASAKRIEIECSGGRLHDGQEVRLGAPVGATAPAGGGAGAGVMVREYEGDRLHREFFASRARVVGTWGEYHRRPRVSVTLYDVDVRLAGMTGAAHRRTSFTLGPYAVPPGVLAKAEGIDLEAFLDDPDARRVRPATMERIRKLKSNLISRLKAKVQAEIHLRLAYGISTFLMVLVGAGLGLLWRGGQMLAAFAISAVPGSVVIMLLFMGRELIRSTGGHAEYGIAVIWGGIAALVAAAGFIYARPLRR